MGQLPQIPGYELKRQVFVSEKCYVYRAYCTRLKHNVMIKLLRDHNNLADEINRFRSEYSMLRNCKIPLAVKAFALERFEGNPFLVLEDIGGESLEHHFKRGFKPDLEEALQIAIHLTSTLATLHHQGLIHRDINPSNIVYNRKKRLLRVIDFGLATLEQQVPAHLPHLGTAAGNLAYVSPEQTGRMGLSVDYRSDLYSLGVTLYHLFTGQKPFTSSDPMQLIHLHLAKYPRPLTQVDQRVPTVLNDIVLKLLRKPPEERYQSCWGLRSDLLRCLTSLQKHGTIPYHPIAVKDIPERFAMPNKLYGRKHETQILIELFHQVSRGSCHLLAASGVAGSGKSTLITQIIKPLTLKRGYYAYGRYQAVAVTAPFSGLLSAAAMLLRNLLTLPDSQLESWRHTLQESFHSGADLLGQLIPEFRLALGLQPYPQETLSPNMGTEDPRTISLLIERLLNLFASEDNPLVLHLDDFHQADPQSLRSVQALMASSQSSHILVILGFRNDEVSIFHPLMRMLQQLPRGYVTTLEVKDLDREAVSQLLADALHSHRQAVEPLANLIFTKTAGNPYFIASFIRSAIANGTLWFSPENQGWAWHLEKIAASEVTGNVLQLLSQRIRSLSDSVRLTLQYASVIGHPIPLTQLADLLSTVKTRTATADNLNKALQTGIIRIEYPPSTTFMDQQLLSDPQAQITFTHESLRQASYQLLAQETRERLHHKLGLQLLCQLRPPFDNIPAPVIYQLASHLNAAGSYLDDPEDQRQRIQMNLRAADHSMQANAYKEAFSYSTTACTQLSSDCWKKHYGLSLKIYSRICQSAYLLGDYSTMRQAARVVEKNARRLRDRLPTYQQLMGADIACGNLGGAYEHFYKAMLQLGFGRLFKRQSHLPTHSSYRKGLRVARRLATGKAIGRKTPKVFDDPDDDIQALKLLQEGFPVMLDQRPNWALRTIGLSLQQLQNQPDYSGIKSSAAYFTAKLAQQLSLKGYLKRSHHIDSILQLSVQLGQASPTPAASSLHLSIVLHTSLRPWKQPWSEGADALEKNFFRGLELGLSQYAADAALGYCEHLIASARPLAFSRSEIEEYMDRLGRLGCGTQRQHLQIWHNWLQQLQKKSSQAKSPASPDPSIGLSCTYQTLLCQLWQACIFDQRQEAQKLATHLAKLPNAQASLYQNQLARFLMLYSHLQALTELPLWQKFRGAMTRIREITGFLRDAQRQPHNSLHHAYLIKAVLAELFCPAEITGRLYDTARKVAHSGSHLGDLALINERCGRFYLRKRRLLIAASYFKKSLSAYRKWQASAKVESLMEQYGELLSLHSDYRQPASTASSLSAAHIDISTLKKALTAIAVESVLSRMVAQIIAAALQFAGAERCVLLLNRTTPQGLFVEADGSVNQDAYQILQSTPLKEADQIPHSIVNYVYHSSEFVVIDDAQSAIQDVDIPDLDIIRDETYIQASQVRSILCVPINVGSGSEKRLIGILYLESTSATRVFTPDRVEMLEIISLAAAGRLELSLKAATDGLTGLYNHEYFHNILHREILQSRRQLRQLSVIMVDIDHFKEFNDLWGHQVGDLVLRQVAIAITQVCRQSDIIARYGGEEISIILPETGPQKAEIVAERIRSAVEELDIFHQGHPLSVTISAGIASLDDSVASGESLIEMADKALYCSKASGRNRVTSGAELAANLSKGPTA